MNSLISLLDGRRAAVICAHPDDETVGAGGCLCRFKEAVFIHVTDGAPRDMRDASTHGFLTREEYAAARRRECLEALTESGTAPAVTVALEYTDQEASLHMVEITTALSQLLGRLEVDTILVHPYEGGHPDHDATAFAVHSAWRAMNSKPRPHIVEFTSYHARAGQIETGAFLPDGRSPEIALRLTSEESARKERMLACYRTQQAVLRQFGTVEERFRLAPAYDFTAPPHPGPLFYEQFPWGMTASRWLALAQRATERLGLC